MTSSVSVTAWQWVRLVASEHGPKSPSARHVLHVLALLMKNGQNFAWPSQETLAKQTGLDVRSVKRGIADARRTGWLSVTESRVDNGRGWRSNQYGASVPAELAVYIPYDKYNRAEGGDNMPPAQQRGGDNMAPAQQRGGDKNVSRWGQIVSEVGTQSPPKIVREESIEESESHSANVGPMRPHVAGNGKNSDDLKNRSPEKKKKKTKAHPAGASVVKQINQRVLKLKLSDDELAAKVRKLRGVGHDDALIKRELSAQADKQQLTRVLKRA